MVVFPGGGVDPVDHRDTRSAGGPVRSERPERRPVSICPGGPGALGALDHPGRCSPSATTPTSSSPRCPPGQSRERRRRPRPSGPPGPTPGGGASGVPRMASLASDAADRVDPDRARPQLSSVAELLALGARSPDRDGAARGRPRCRRRQRERLGLPLPPSADGARADDRDRTRYSGRILAPNPGPMTLDGTNTWVLGPPGGGPRIVVDPGPAGRSTTCARSSEAAGELPSPC